MQNIYKKISFSIGTFFCSGYSPFAPGTAGSFATLPFAFLMAYFYGFYGILISTIIIFFIGTFATKEVLKYTKHDPSFIVIDEVAGQLLTFLPIAYLLQYNINYWYLYFIGFILFRLFDITKPQPAKWADSKILNAWGVMLDDIFAGIYAGIVLYIISILI